MKRKPRLLRQRRPYRHRVLRYSVFIRFRIGDGPDDFYTGSLGRNGYEPLRFGRDDAPDLVVFSEPRPG